MEHQSIYFDIDLAANLETRARLDVASLPFERIVGELFRGSVVLIDRYGSCRMLNGVPIARIIHCFDGFLHDPPPRPDVPADRAGCADLTFHLQRRTHALILTAGPDDTDSRLEFDPATFEALWNVKKKNAGTLFWLLYPELEAHAAAGKLRALFAGRG